MQKYRLYVLRFAVVIALLGAGSMSAGAALMLYDGFGGTSGANIEGNGGGTGWGGALWYNNNAVANVGYTSPGLSYSSLQVSGNKATATGGDLGAFRFMNNGTLGNGNVSYWISFVAQSGSAGNSYGGVSLYSGDSSESFFIGQRNGQNTFGIERSGGANGNSSVSAGSQSLLVIRVDFTDASESARLWVNPTLGAVPTDSSAAVTLSGLANFTFDTIRIQSGGSTSFSVDEFRFGTSFLDVTPVPEPVGVALGIFGSVGGIGGLVRWRLKRQPVLA